MPLMFDVADGKRVRVIVDTDAACEADDPFAIAHALMSPKLLVKAVIAEHFAAEGSMEKSHSAILRLTQKMRADVPVLRGEPWPLQPDAQPSQGVRFIVEEARREDPHPLYVLCLGALTNIARALGEAPDIAARLTVVSIGGQAYDGDVATIREFNFGNDVPAANAVLRAEVPLIQIPLSAYGMMRVGLAELQRKVYPCGEVGRYLFEQMVNYNATPAAAWTQGESWSLGDSPAVGVVLNTACAVTERRKAMRVNPDTTYAPDPHGREITVVKAVDQRYILEDFFAKLALLYGA